MARFLNWFTLRGGNGADFIDAWSLGLYNNDVVFYGKAGDDTLVGGNGRDYLAGHKGNDYVHGNYGDDTLYGNNGNDTLIGGEGSDSIFAGTGHDYVSGYEAVPQFDFIDMGAGNDRADIAGDFINLGRGNDAVTVHMMGGSHNTVYTGQGRDVVTAITLEDGQHASLYLGDLQPGDIVHVMRHDTTGYHEVSFASLDLNRDGVINIFDDPAPSGVLLAGIDPNAPLQLSLDGDGREHSILITDPFGNGDSISFAGSFDYLL